MSIRKAAIPGWNPAVPQRSSRTSGWWIAATICWLLAAFASEAIATAIGALAQPDQAAWVSLFRSLPAMPPLFVVIITGIRTALYRRRTWSTALVPKLLFWASLALLLLAIPKPN